MNSNEIRINNYFQTRDGKTDIVRFINTSVIGGKNGEYKIAEVCPVPLTEVRAEKLGFKQNSPGRWSKRHFHKFELTKPINGGEVFSAVKYIKEDSYYVLVVGLNSVHQLQNLYFAMEETELQIEK
jgi:hypothetical protein